MIIYPRISLSRLILSLSQVLDHVHPTVIDHQLRAAYISTRIAKKIGLSKLQLLDLMLAGALHDIGIIGIENRINGLQRNDWEDVPWHSEAGYSLLSKNGFFSQAAQIVRYHHTSWDGGNGEQCDIQTVPPGSWILVLADRIERMIDRAVNILDQTETIKAKVISLAGSKFKPDCVEAFCEISEQESFWLDSVSGNIREILLEEIDWPVLTMDEETLEPIAKIFAVITDATSKWTATHSAGVSAAAVALAERHNFSAREQSMMKSAGYLHDIGKLTIPTKILDKPGKLTEEERNVINSHTYHTFRMLNTIGGMGQISEWAAFHHERLDGNGYPFHHSAKDLTLGARIMAVADVFGALTEERPYHKAMDRDKVMGIIKKLAGNNGLDYNVVSILEKDYDTIYDISMHERISYDEDQKLLLTDLNILSVVAEVSKNAN